MSIVYERTIRKSLLFFYQMFGNIHQWFQYWRGWIVMHPKPNKTFRGIKSIRIAWKKNERGCLITRELLNYGSFTSLKGHLKKRLLATKIGLVQDSCCLESLWASMKSSPQLQYDGGQKTFCLCQTVTKISKQIICGQKISVS